MLSLSYICPYTLYISRPNPLHHGLEGNFRSVITDVEIQKLDFPLNFIENDETNVFNEIILCFKCLGFFYFPINRQIIPA